MFRTGVAALAFGLALSTAADAKEPWADAVSMGDCATVLRETANPQKDAARLARGWCMRNTDPNEALIMLGQVSQGVYRDYALWLRGEALLEAGRADDAARAFAGLKLPGEAGLRLRLARARTALAKQDSLSVREDLRALLHTSVRDEARYLLALGGVQRDELDAAKKTFARTWAESVQGPWANLAAEALKGLGAPVPDAKTPHGRQLMHDRVASLAKAQQHAEALELTLALKDAGDDIPQLVLGKRYFKARRYDDAVHTWKLALGPAETAHGSASALFDYALAMSRTGDYDRAAVIYSRLLAQHPSTKTADLASYKLGYLEYDRRNCEAAERKFTEHVGRFPSSKHLESALWFKGWCQWRRGEMRPALSTWEELLRRRPNSKLAPAVAYWTAMSRYPESRDAALARLIERYPQSGHAWFAAERLGRTFPRQPEVDRPAWPASMLARDDVHRAEALLNAGFKRWARAELAPLERLMRHAERPARLAAAHAFVAAGAYRSGRALVRDLCRKPTDTSANPVVQQVCYPRPEASIVAAATQRWKLPPTLPFAIMHVESALNPEVTSIAGARGLMQLMPDEGPALHAKAFPNGNFDADNLYLGPYNAMMGTTALGIRREALEGKLTPATLPAVIAAYNGGLEAVERWLGEHDGTPVAFDTFSEEIGYTETRRYVRSVLGRLMAYRWVYGDEHPDTAARIGEE